MKIKQTLLREYLKARDMTPEILAAAMDVHVSEIEKLLAGDAADIKTAQCFIEYFGADTAQALIDWDAIGRENPLACEADKESNV